MLGCALTLVKLLCSSFDVENGSGPGRSPLEGGSQSGVLLQKFPQRRESFIYRSDSDYDLSPKVGAARHSSSLTADRGSDVLQ